MGAKTYPVTCVSLGRCVPSELSFSSDFVLIGSRSG